jgi:hypothetical protein
VAEKGVEVDGRFAAFWGCGWMMRWGDVHDCVEEEAGAAERDHLGLCGVVCGHGMCELLESDDWVKSGFVYRVLPS